MTNEELVAAASPIVQRIGASFYFTADTLAQGAALGLDAVGFYVMGRGGVLGDVEPAVVGAAFGYFNPTLVAGAWAAGLAKVSPREAGRAFWEASARHGRAKLSSVAHLDNFVRLAAIVHSAADADGLALFAGIAAEPLADDAPGRAMQLMTALREFRGSAHLVALRACGVSSKDAHFVKRPTDVALFGWTAADAPVIDDALLGAMDEAEALTDRMVGPAWAAIDDVDREHMVQLLETVEAAINAP
jgi:hypothetical protein